MLRVILGFLVLLVLLVLLESQVRVVRQGSLESRENEGLWERLASLDPKGLLEPLEGREKMEFPAMREPQADLETEALKENGEIKGFQEKEESREKEEKLETEGPLVLRGRLVRKENQAHLDLQQHRGPSICWEIELPWRKLKHSSEMKYCVFLKRGFQTVTLRCRRHQQLY